MCKCTAKFLNRAQLFDHQVTVHGERLPITEQIVCRGCDVGFENMENIIEHIQVCPFLFSKKVLPNQTNCMWKKI